MIKAWQKVPTCSGGKVSKKVSVREACWSDRGCESVSNLLKINKISGIEFNYRILVIY